eukprot:6138040-Amphidinium_carterae.4
MHPRPNNIDGPAIVFGGAALEMHKGRSTRDDETEPRHTLFNRCLPCQRSLRNSVPKEYAASPISTLIMQSLHGTEAKLATPHGTITAAVSMTTQPFNIVASTSMGGNSTCKSETQQKK